MATDKSAKRNKRNRQKISPKQQAEREAKALERQKAYEEEKERKKRLKKIVIAFFAIVLALGLMLPTAGLTLLSM